MTHRSAATKFTFDTVFAEEPGAVSPTAKSRQKKTLTNAEIEALRAEARAEGMQEAQIRAAEATAAAVQETANALKHLLERSHAEIEAVRAEAATLALKAAKILARAALDAFPAAEVENVLRSFLHQAIGEPRIVLRTSPQVAEALRPRLPDIAHEEGYEGKIQISGDPNLRSADCRIEWRGGGAERSEATLEAALSDIIARRFHPIQHSLTED